MKLPALYICMLAILFQPLFASTSSSGETASLKSMQSRSMAKSVVGKLARKRKAQGAAKKNKRVCKGDVAKDKSKSLSAILPKTLVAIVIDYFKDDAYSILVSTHSNWSFKDEPQVAVDTARLYVIAKSEGLEGLDHSAANLKEEERRCIQFGGPQWPSYYLFSSSHDGRYVFFRHSYKVSTDCGERTEFGTKWLAQDNELGCDSFKRVAFDGESLLNGLFSRDGQTVFSCSSGMSATRVYQIVQEAGKDPAASLKREINANTRAVSGKGNRAMVAIAEQLEIHDISKDAAKLVCQINTTGFIYTCALNEDGSEAAFVKDDVLQIMDVDKVMGDKANQPAIVPVKVAEPLKWIYQLVYSAENKLHVLHPGGRVSLFDPLARTLIPIEAPEEGQRISNAAISPNADYFASIQYVGKKEKWSDKHIYRTIVRRKLGSPEWTNLFGYEADKAVKWPQAGGEPTRGATIERLGSLHRRCEQM